MKGANFEIFTPDVISKRMSGFLHSRGTLLEPSVGDGALLRHLDLSNYHVDVYDIKREYLDKCPCGIHKHHTDFIRADISHKYDNIILNPPFIRIQNLPDEDRNWIKKEWVGMFSGNFDIYYAFLMKCINLLADTGIMVAITPNSFMYNKSAAKFRQYLEDNKLVREIIDFGSEKVFKGVSTYCCITVITKDPNNTYKFNVNSNGSNAMGKVCNIMNGIATLRDKIFIHETKLYDEPCWKPVAHPAGDRWAIYPYNAEASIITEDIFKVTNPQTYKYLMENKDELAKRDNGNKTYVAWYAYGRTQAIKIPTCEHVVLIPPFCNPRDMRIVIREPILFSSYICISSDTMKVEEIKEVLQINKDKLIASSPKRGGGWVNLSTSAIKALDVI